MPNDITVSMPLVELVQLYNALDMLVNEANDADVEHYLPPAVLKIATSRRDEFKVLIRNGLDLDLGGA